jgi:tetratricopeptide (TPR) repeat protein
MPTLSHPADLTLAGDVLRENDPDPQRILLWLRGPRDERGQAWQRLSGHLLARLVLAEGVHAAPVRVAEFRQDARSDLRRAFDSFWGGRRQGAGRYILPTGDWVEGHGQSRGDALLAWTAEPDTPLDPGRVARLWPGNEGCRQLGPNVFLVLGVELPAEPPPAVKRKPPPPAPAPTPAAAPEPGGISDQELQRQLEERGGRAKDLARSGRHAEARAEARQMLAWAREQRGNNHPWVATCLILLGWLHQVQDQDDAAEPLYREALGITCPVLGDAHPNFATGLNNLAVVYLNRGKLADAEALHRQALGVRRATLQGEHPLLATSLNNLALVYHVQGDTTTAESLLRQAADMFRQTLGDDHPDLASCLGNLASFYASLGDEAAAESTAADARRVREAGRGKEHVVVADTLNALLAVPAPDAPPSAFPEERREPVTECAAAGETTVEAAGEPGDGFSGAVSGAAGGISDAGLASWLASSSVPNYSWAEEEPSRSDGQETEGVTSAGHGLVGEAVPESPAAGQVTVSAAGPALEPPEVEEPEAHRGLAEDSSSVQEDSVVSAPAPDDHTGPPEVGGLLIDDDKPVEDWVPVEDVAGGTAVVPPAAEEAATRESLSLGEIEAILTELASPEPAGPEGLFIDVPAQGEATAEIPSSATEAAPGNPLLEPPAFQVDEPDPAGPITPEGALPETQEEAAPVELLQVPLPPAGEAIPPEPPPTDAGHDLVEPDHDAPGTEPPLLPPGSEESAAAEKGVVMLHGPDAAVAERPGTDSPPVDRGESVRAYETEAPRAGPHKPEAPARGTDEPEAPGPRHEAEAPPGGDGSHSLALRAWMAADLGRPGVEAETGTEDAPLGSGGLPPTAPVDCPRETEAAPEPVNRVAWEPTRPLAEEANRDDASPPSESALACASEGRLEDALRLLRRLPRQARPGGSPAAVPTDLDLVLTLVRQHLAGVPAAVRAALDFILRGRAPLSNGEAPGDCNRTEVSGTLPARGALVEFVRFRPDDPSGDGSPASARYLAFVLPGGEPDNVTLVDLGDAGTVDRLVADFRAWVTGEQAGVRTAPVLRPPLARGVVPPAGLTLRQAVFDPLAGALGGRSRLFLAPAGNLACLPFEVLPHPDGRALLDTHQISYVTTGLDVLRFGTDPRGEPGPSVVAVDPDFDLFLAASRAPGTSAPRLADSGDSGPPRFERLTGSRRGGKRFAELLGVEPWLGGAVRKGRLQELHSPRVLHLGTHGFFAEDETGDLGRAGLALAGANGTGPGSSVAGDGDAGLLTAGEVAALDLDATEVVVLSACDTGPAAAPVGESVLALRRAFGRAGAAAVVATLWKVTDWHVKELLTDFYRRVLAGEPRADALRQAQLALKDRYPDNPEYWGAFICQGDPGPLRHGPAGGPEADAVPRARGWGWPRRG